MAPAAALVDRVWASTADAPALLYRDASRLFARDDDDTTTDHHYAAIIAGIFGVLIALSIGVCTRDHFRGGGTWRAYFKSWGKAIFFVLMLTVFLPLTILGMFINCHRDRKKKRAGAPPAAVPLRTRTAAYPSDPPQQKRPQMPLDAVVIVPDMPDLDDPDAVDAIQRPAPALQKPASTSEATAAMIDGDDANGAPSKTGP